MTKKFDIPTYYTEDDLAEEGFRSLGRNVRIARNCTIVGAENIAIGNNVRIDGFCTLVAAGSGRIKLGSFVHVGGYCALLGGAGITMEDFSGLSWGVKIFSRSDDFSGKYLTNPTVPAKYTGGKGGPVVLMRHAVVGSDTILLPGVTLGEGVAVGAMSMVTKSLEEWGIYMGSPAKRLKSRSRKLLDLEKAFLADLAQEGVLA